MFIQGTGLDALIDRFDLSMSTHDTPLPIVYGYNKVKGRIIYREDKEENNYDLAIGLCEGEIESIGRYTIDGVEDGDTGGAITLTKKYGKPKMDFPGVWKNDLYKDDKSEWGFAVSLGHLAYGASWETSTTKIEIMLSGDNYKINLILSYFSKELEEWVKQTEEKEALKDL